MHRIQSEFEAQRHEYQLELEQLKQQNNDLNNEKIRLNGHIRSVIGVELMGIGV